MACLNAEKCLSTAAVLSDSARTTLLEALPDWQYDASKRELQREFRFKNYYHVMSFVNAIAWLANKEGHHPDMEVSYNRVLLRFTTHDAGGVTRNDVICAAKSDALLQLGDVGPVLQV